MRRLSHPPFDAEATFLACVSKTRPPLRTQLQAISGQVRVADDKYVNAATAGEVHKLVPSSFSPHSVTVAEVLKSYSGGMVAKNGPGRPIYDALKLAAPNQICPLCDQGIVATLDHFLPKTTFPLLAVAPLNLVPCCTDCNFLKSSYVAASAVEVLLNPYFDFVDDVKWLEAAIIEAGPPAATYRVRLPHGFDPVLGARLRRHFKVFRLARSYSLRANAELGDIRAAVGLAFDRGGASAVRQQLQDQADSRREASPNSWSAALYTALESSAWYCGGGFRE